MKRSVYQQILGCLMEAGREDLVKAMTVTAGSAEQKMFDDFIAGRSPTSRSAHLKVSNLKENVRLLSDYDVPICLFKDHPGQIGELWLNTEKYSVTTSKTQRYIQTHLPSYQRVREVNEKGIRAAIQSV